MHRQALTLEQFTLEPYPQNPIGKIDFHLQLWVELLIAQQDFEEAHRRLHQRGDDFARGKGLITWVWFGSRDPYATARVRVGFRLGLKEMLSRKSTAQYMLGVLQTEVIDRLDEAEVRFRLVGIRSRGRIYTPITPIERLAIETDSAGDRWPWKPGPDLPAR